MYMYTIQYNNIDIVCCVNVMAAGLDSWQCIFACASHNRRLCMAMWYNFLFFFFCFAILFLFEDYRKCLFFLFLSSPPFYISITNVIGISYILSFDIHRRPCQLPRIHAQQSIVIIKKNTIFISWTECRKWNFRKTPIINMKASLCWLYLIFEN